MRRALLFLAAGMIAGVFALPYVAPIRPAELQPNQTSIAFLDRSGAPLGVVSSSGDVHTQPVPLSQISRAFLAAIIASEDRRFFSHHGIDWLAVARAAAKGAGCMCGAGGASTITMQLARTRFHIASGARGKLLQMWYARRIEAGSDKRSILKAYVNSVAMGGNLYGIEAASRDYFGVPARDLDLAQSALLAGIPNDPSDLEPRSHWVQARARQRYVLRRLAATGAVSGAEVTAAIREPLHLQSERGELIAAQHLLFRLARALPPQTLPVRTTIDLDLQRFVQAQAQEIVQALSDRNVTQAAALVIDNHTGEVLAYLGSVEYFNDPSLGRNDGVQALRQPGSALKPFLYELALERGTVAPDTILADVPTWYAIPNGELYSPEDYSLRFSGPVPLRAALANSLNVPAVRVLSMVSVPSFLDRLRALGFTHLKRSPDFYGLGLTLGAGEVTLWDLTHAYVTLARSGNVIPLRTTLSERLASGVQVGDRGSWQFVTDVLADRYARAKAFGLGSVIDLPFPAAVKTGTSSDYRDTWTIGYTPEYTVGVWVGNFSGTRMQRVAGMTGAGPLWNRIMLHLYERRDPPRFARPSRIDARPSPAKLAQLEQNPSYDEWRLRQEDTIGKLRILFPHDGAIFEDALVSSDARRGRQEIAFRISRPAGADVSWIVNGKRVAHNRDDAYFWPVRTGTWTLSVASRNRRDSVRFRVYPVPPRGMRGFAVIR